MNLENIPASQDMMSGEVSSETFDKLFPFPPDWWKCLRLTGSICGEYSSQQLFGRGLVLRVDIEPRSNSPSMNRISGDFYKTYLSFVTPGKPPKISTIYQESWIVDSPSIKWTRCAVGITGKVRFWKGTHPATEIQVSIPWNSGKIGPAEVTFLPSGGNKEQYTCSLTSDCFRSMNLEVDVCKSVNSDPILPSYDTYAHSVRPVDLKRRTLDIENAYWEAGVKVDIRGSERTIIDDSDSKFDRWSPAELHDAMEQHFSQYPRKWPNWEMWGLLAGLFENDGTAGIMFDAGASYGGAGQPPDRQGFAVFRKHSWFDKLVAGTPAGDEQADAMRQYLYCWIHEAGHAFNLLHSWNKNRSCALSWMNYPWMYDQNQQCLGTFWSKFMMRFDDEELIHIRHGDLLSVVMGGDPWASGGHFEMSSSVMAPTIGEMPLELLIRSKIYFDLMEPVVIELRLRNLMDIPITIEEKLKPEFGNTTLFIHRPDGKIVEFNPIFCQLNSPTIKALDVSDSCVEGADRYSDTIFFNYGKGGFYFDTPGEYMLRAFYNANGLLIPSNVQKIRIGSPTSRNSDILATEFFTYPVGMSLYLHGSRSPFLSEGMDFLTCLAETSPDTMLGAKVGSRIAPSIGRPFFRIIGNTLTMTHNAEPKKALQMTEPAVELYRSLKGTEAKLTNISYNKLIRGRANFLTRLGQKTKAKEEVSVLKDDLSKRGVNEVVLNEIDALEKTL